MKTATNQQPKPLPFVAHGLGLPPGRVYSFLTYVTLGANIGTLESIYTTKDPVSFSETLQRLKAMTVDKPKLRSPTYGNARRVGVVSIDNEYEAEQLLRSGHLSALPAVGHVFDSVKEAGKALALSGATLAEYFHRARKRNGGSDSPVVVRGFQLSYTSTPDWQNARLPVSGRISGPLFKDMGGRKSSAETKAAMNQLSPEEPKPASSGPQLPRGAGRV